MLSILAGYCYTRTSKKKKHYPVLHIVHQLDNSTDNEDDDDNGDESSGDD